MRAQMARRFESHRAFLAGFRVIVCALKGLLFQMSRQHMLLERRVLAESLIARRIPGAPVFVLAIMCSQMPSKSRACHKTLSTTWTITDIVSNSGMGTFDVVVQVRGSKKGLVAAVESAVK
jgi:hypothetical protein